MLSDSTSSTKLQYHLMGTRDCSALLYSTMRLNVSAAVRYKQAEKNRVGQKRKKERERERKKCSLSHLCCNRRIPHCYCWSIIPYGRILGKKRYVSEI